MRYTLLVLVVVLMSSCSKSDVDEGRLDYTSYIINNQSNVDLYYLNRANTGILINAGESELIEVLFVQVGANFTGSTIVNPVDHYLAEQPFEIFENISQFENVIEVGELLYSQNPVDESLWILDLDTRTFTITITNELIE
ncbi:hypothetical protein [uncultured Kordia sp.]|uniref:hypothetical protein n=1 Tax=uncultured Kordia sp. TaxID=507699 RepID=UPI002620A5C6|nr:hypothetical protein [uncultured Kordia sp.]